MANLAYAERARAHRLALVISTILSTGLAVPALAQDVATPLPPRVTLDENGVEIATGKFVASHVDLSIGPNGQGGLNYTRFLGGIKVGSNWDVRLSIPQNGTVVATLHGDSYKFTSVAGGYDSADGKGAKLSLPVNGKYTLTTISGVKVVYDSALVGYSTINGVWTHEAESFARAVSITYPNGYAENLYYASMDVCTAQSPCTRATAVRLQAVTNSYGYQLHFNYGNDVSTGYNPNYLSWSAVSSVQALNTKVENCDPLAITCTGLVNNWPVATSSGATSPAGRSFTYTNFGTTISISNDDGTIKTVNKPAGQNPYLNPVNKVTVRGSVWNYSYSVSGNVATLVRTDPRGATRTYVSDVGKGVVTSVTNELGKVTSYDHDTLGRLTGITFPEGNKYTYSYDANGNQTGSTQVSKTPGSPADEITSASFPCSSEATCDKPAWTRDAKGNQTDYTYDAVTGNILTVTAPAATTGAARPTTTYSYTAANGVQLVTGISVCQTGATCAGTADEIKTTIAYNGNLLPATLSKGAGNGSVSATTSIGYDNIGNQSSVDGPASGANDTALSIYDPDRLLLAEIGPDPDGTGARKRVAHRYSYNAYAQQTNVELGTVASMATDMSSFTAAQATQTAYDSFGRKATDTVIAGGTTQSLIQYSYDATSRVDCVAIRMNVAAYGALPASACTPGTSGADGPDRITKYTYDNADHTTKVTSAYGTADASDDVTTTYSNNGRVATVADANSHVTSYGYDGFDRLATATYWDSSFEQFGYDANNNITSRRLRDGTSVSFTFDNRNQLVTKTLPGSEPAVGYTYDLLGRPITISKSGSTITRAYDALSRLTSEAQPFGTISYQYDAAGNRTRMSWWDGFYVTYEYDSAGEVTTIKENGSASLASFGYNDLGLRTSLTRGNGTATSYGFDPLSRLSTQGMDFAGTLGDQSLGFGYNPASQITSTTRSNDSYTWAGAINADRNYTTNGLNQYTAAGTTALGYDLRGNLTNSGSSVYTYSAENLLKSAPGGVALYYDALNRLNEYDTPTSTRFVYDGREIVAEVANPSGVIVKRYIGGPTDNEPLVEYDASGNKTWLIADERGSVVARSDASGNVANINSYDEYGIPGGANAGRFQYTGQAFLSEVGLYYYGARFYSPTLGRFMQTDPIGYGDGINWYDYGRSDPVNATDPDGTTESTTNPYVSSNYINNFTTNSPVMWCADGTSQYSCDGHGGPSEILVMGGKYVGGFGAGWGSWSGSMANQVGACSLAMGGCPNFDAKKADQPSTWGCIGSALWENKTGLALDGLGWLANAVVPEASVGTAVVGSVLGVAGIVGATADAKKSGAGDALATGTMAYVGKQAAVGEGILRGAPSQLAHRIGVRALFASTLYDAAKTAKSFYQCKQGK